MDGAPVPRVGWSGARLSPRQRLRDARLSLGLTQREVASRCGVHRSQISRLELGEWWPHPLVLDRIARACGVSGAWVLTGR